jgi:uncharacterized protein (UPF0332 family)
MSPRSIEFMASARERLRGAEHALAASDRDLSVSAAYYAMLYAARAALPRTTHMPGRIRAPGTSSGSAM